MEWYIIGGVFLAAAVAIYFARKRHKKEGGVFPRDPGDNQQMR
jgi:LPXTG-motif cell wall-anchored protein